MLLCSGLFSKIEPFSGSGKKRHFSLIIAFVLKMKVLVAVKRGIGFAGRLIVVVDHAVKVRVNSSTKRINTKGVKMVMNPFCEIAMEEAIRLKEKRIANEVVAVSIGPKVSQEQLRYCIALGADRGSRYSSLLSRNFS